jgi:outer membrane receptor protein involved in Fe transport
MNIYGFNIADSAIGVPGDPNLFANDVIWFERIRSYQRQLAAFGQLDADFTPRLHGAVGLRYLAATSTEDRIGGGFYNLGTVNPFGVDIHFNATTPRFSLLYDLSEQSTLYTTVAKGYRLGGPTGPTPSGPGNSCEVTGDYAAYGIVNPPTTYKSDSLWSYELGTKNRALRHLVRECGRVLHRLEGYPADHRAADVRLCFHR